MLDISGEFGWVGVLAGAGREWTEKMKHETIQKYTPRTSRRFIF